MRSALTWKSGWSGVDRVTGGPVDRRTVSQMAQKRCARAAQRDGVEVASVHEAELGETRRGKKNGAGGKFYCRGEYRLGGSTEKPEDADAFDLTRATNAP